MGELRHDRASIRFHRERVIKKKKALFDAIWFHGYLGDKDPWYQTIIRRYDPPPLGKLAKHSTHHHSNDYCSPRYNRAKEKNKFNQGLD